MTEKFDSSDALTLPNAITAIRILGSPVLVVLAIADRPGWLAGFAVFLVFTEWLDGFLARRLHVTSAIGARLDTVADAVFYTCLLAAVVVLRPAQLGRESVWIALAIATYAMSWLTSWLKFRCLPSYHTWAAKGVWVVVGVGIVLLLANVTPWPFRIAMVCVALANIEAIGITFLLPVCRVDVPSIWTLRRSSLGPGDR